MNKRQEQNSVLAGSKINDICQVVFSQSVQTGEGIGEKASRDCLKH